MFYISRASITANFFILTNQSAGNLRDDQQNTIQQPQ